MAPGLKAVFDLNAVEPATLSAPSAINLVCGFQRYETAIEGKLYRAINQLERLQRARRGEVVAAPQTLNVSIHSGSERESYMPSSNVPSLHPAKMADSEAGT